MERAICNLVEELNAEKVEDRLNALEHLMKKIREGELPLPPRGDDVNNHIHTSYSFSPYSPTKAIYMAYLAGLTTAGIMDHDSISGAREFIAAGEIAGMATTIGVECRVDFSRTPLNGKRINNPDQKSIAYIALHGIPHTQIDRVKEFFIPYSKARNARNRKMVDRINGIMEPHKIYLSFDEDVLPLSRHSEGGSVTERHILFGLSLKLIERYGKGQRLVDFLKDSLRLDVKSKIEKYLLDESNPFYEYDLLGVLKSDLVSAFYVDAVEECPDVREIVEFSNQIGAVCAYAYLGDVYDSVTGDKRAQKFEDDYLDLLFRVIKDLGFHAVTYMPSRNSMEQLMRVKNLCEAYGFFQISGEDINSPRQSFVCNALRDEAHKNLVESTWALIGHEKAATDNLECGMFTSRTVVRYPDLDERIRVYGEIGKGKKQ